MQKFPFKILSAVVLAAVFGVATGCHSSRKMVATGGPATEILPVETLKKRLAENAFSASRLTAKAAIEINSDGQNFRATAQIIWVKDSCLWLSVKKFGIEGARALLTRDSVFLLNRLEQTFMAESIGWLTKKYNLPAHFELVNALALGQAWLLPEAKMTSSIRDSLHLLSGSTGALNEELLIENGRFALKSMRFMQKRESRSLTLGFRDWQPVVGQKHNFSFLRHVNASSPETGNLQIEAELSDVEFNKIKPFRFEIPAHYRRI